jgi:diacylglycerol kinase (ATP)
MGETILVVANPRSGRGKSKVIAEEFANKATAAGLSPIVFDVLGQEEMILTLHHEIENHRSNIRGIVSVGGDGLLHTLLPIIHKYDLPFTVVPTGTGNDFAREIGAMSRSLDQTVTKIFEAPSNIDSVIIKSDRGDSRACQVLSLGFDALVNERANGFRHIRGKLKYVLATIRELPLFKPQHFDITIDGRNYSRRAMLIAVANGPSYGGGMKICPSARFDDGVLDVLILSEVSIFELIRVFPKVYSGSHVSHPAIEIIKGREISVSAPAKAFADGEFIAELPISIHVEPGSLKVWR